jgi:hypothetical protein
VGCQAGGVCTRADERCKWAVAKRWRAWVLAKVAKVACMGAGQGGLWWRAWVLGSGGAGMQAKYCGPGYVVSSALHCMLWVPQCCQWWPTGAAGCWAEVGKSGGGPLAFRLVVQCTGKAGRGQASQMVLCQAGGRGAVK